MLVAIGAGIAVLTGLGAAIYGFIIGLLIILMLK